MIFWCVSAALAVSPTIALTWTADRGLLVVEAPEGHELAVDAPATVRLSWADTALVASTDGAALVRGIPLGDLRSSSVVGMVDLTLCAKVDGHCAPVQVAVDGEVPGSRRGRVLLRSRVAAPAPAEELSPFQADAAALADAAFAASAEDGRPVLLDFSAVWCPPCNALAAEVLYAEPPPEVLAGFHVVVVDVDDASSWPLKDRYGVGGYPTVVVADASRAMIRATTGYTDRADFLAWLTALSAGGPTDPSAVSPLAAADEAWTRLSQGETDVAGWIARAEEAPPTRSLRLARAVLEPTVEDVRWLLEHAPETVGEWAYASRGLAEADEVLHADILAALHRGLPGASGDEAVSLCWLAGAYSSEEAAARWSAAAAMTLRTSLTGDPALDRSRYTALARYTAKGGDVDGAVAFLREQAERYADEPTWHLTAARILLDAQRPAEALAWAEEGMARSWGDNRLRVAALEAAALQALGREADAAQVAVDVLAELPDPGALDVRTSRYRAKLEAFLAP